MKVVYILLALIIVVTGIYFATNNFSFNSTAFSAFLINGLFITLVGGLLAGGLAFLISLKRKQHYKGMMTIRQYYDYKS
ncbi:LPXTG cell wall anchor domain-containing protein [Flavobacterium sp. RHBU_24]|uniref:LPXTG cell wall anchor domain-containing protein n=1 Tax=Flavobacterium sp. RHBU_24 TaxID=3391185 RepID=UPI003984A306